MSLGDDLRLRFKAFDLQKSGIHVRDDYDAKVLYFVEIGLDISGQDRSEPKESQAIPIAR